MSQTLYLAGPMRGIPDFNFPAFFEAESRLVSVGYEVISPARRDVDNGFEWEGRTGNEDLSELDMDLAEVLLWDLQAVSTADGVALLDGYENSKGAAAEIALAKALGIPVRMVHEWAPSKTVGPAWKPVAPPITLHKSERLYTQFSPPAEPGVMKSADLPQTMHGGAVKVVSETGGEKGKKLEELGSYDPLALRELGKVSGFGAQKYDTFNYLKGYDWSLSFNAMMRHAMAFWNGEDFDDETGLPHMAHAMWHAGALVSFLMRDLGSDDRVTSVVKGA